jgi:hypothetical protein
MSAGSATVPGARHTVVPKGIVSTAWPKVSQTCRNIGWRFDPWQDATGRLILAKSDGGKWAADLSILSIPRQVGKSYLFGCIIFALCLLNPRLRVIWTSHHTATTEEMYDAMKELARHKRVAPHVVKCIALQGSRWRIQFRNGSRIDFGARSQGFGRGKARVGVLVLDEFQHITARALANLTPTTNTADNPLILCAGTPPGPESSGDAFTLRRKAALEGISDDTLYVEFSADADADKDDRRQWAKANPSFPKRTGERAFLLNRKMLSEGDFGREALGIWDEAPKVDGIPIGRWLDLQGAPGQVGGPTITLDVALTRTHSSIGIGAQRSDGRVQVELVSYGPGTAWAVQRCAELSKTYGRPVVLAGNGPAASLTPDLEALGVPVEVLGGPEVVQACGGMLDAVNEGTVVPVVDRDAPELAAVLAQAVEAAALKGGESFVFTRKSAIDISPLYAVTLARWVASRQSVGGFISLAEV